MKPHPTPVCVESPYRDRTRRCRVAARPASKAAGAGGGRVLGEVAAAAGVVAAEAAHRVVQVVSLGTGFGQTVAQGHRSPNPCQIRE
jgi:hypothetical protein